MPAKEPKISAGASRTLNNLLDSAADVAFSGSMHPDAQDLAEQRYDRAVRAIRRLINRLEANQK